MEPAEPIADTESKNTECQISKMVFGGWGLTHMNGKTVFVSNVAAGEKVLARIYKKAKGVRYAECEGIIEANANDRTPKRCQHAGICGGCSYQHIHHGAQLRIKEDILRETFQGQHPLGQTIVSPREFNYRNKMEYGFTRPPDGEITYGLHPRGRFRHILDLQECHLINPDLWAAGQKIKSIIRRDYPNDTTGQDGFWQHLILRQSFTDNSILAGIEAESLEDPRLAELAANIMREIPGCAGVFGKKRHGLPVAVLGKNYLEENILGAQMRYYAENFFQVNVSILPELMPIIADLVREAEPKLLYDLFSGVGLFGVCLAHLIGQEIEVVAAESDRSAAEIANENAKLNNLQNYQSLALDLYQKGWGEQLKRRVKGNSVAIIDPPRAGLTNNTVAEIARLSPDRLIYVSCNPTTQKRDIDWLKAHGYKQKGLRLIDMFPQTYHLESLAWLDKE